MKGFYSCLSNRLLWTKTLKINDLELPCQITKYTVTYFAIIGYNFVNNRRIVFRLDKTTLENYLRE